MLSNDLENSFLDYGDSLQAFFNKIKNTCSDEQIIKLAPQITDIISTYLELAKIIDNRVMPLLNKLETFAKTAQHEGKERTQ